MQDRRIQRVGAVANRAYRGTRLSSGDLERQEGIRRGEHLGFFSMSPYSQTEFVLTPFPTLSSVWHSRH